MAHYYGHQNPNMKYAVEMQDTNINMPQQNITVSRDRPNWSWCSTVWSSIVLICCCPLFGFIGLMCSSFSYTDHKSGDFDRANKKRKCSWGWSMSGLVLGILMIVAIVVLYSLFWAQLLNAFNQKGWY